jgi:acetylornithine/succinyldiaminopimelate/putrescine aminotransferase
MSQNKSVFRKITADTCQMMIEMNQKKEPTFILPTKYVSKEAAQLGYLLNEMSNTVGIQPLRNYKSFFCNSGNEALQGSIKVIRHYGYRQYKKHQGRILIYTSDCEIYPQFDIKLSHGHKLYPNIMLVNKLDEMKQLSQNKPILSSIFVINKIEELDEIDTYLGSNQYRDMVIGLDLSMIPVQDIKKIKTGLYGIDIIIWGEELSNREIPFGAFSMTNKVYSSWNTIATCLIHSSTYGGNMLSLKKVLSHVLSCHNNKYQYEKKIQEIGGSYESRKKYFSAYVNPKLIKLYTIMGYDFDVKKAEGSYLTIEKNKKQYKVFDCVGGGGLSIFGHNPEDLVDQVINQHDDNIDYVGQLSRQLKRMTGYDCFFPTVSGASAVETAMMLGLMGQSEKRQKVLVFKGNYAGKLLLPLIGTQISSHPNYFFQPIYENIVVVDPFMTNVVEHIKSILKEENIGLIWFEYIRGQDAKKIPQNVIDIIEEKRTQYRYYIGIDEILCGMCRTGPFMSIEATKLKPDITTLSKGLTYMTFPIGGALIRDEVIKKAGQKNEVMVNYLKTRYQNQMGAHIACHCLDRIKKEMISKNVIDRAMQLENQIKESQIPKIEAIERNGLYFRIILKKPWWIKIGIMSELLTVLWLVRVVKKWLIKGGIFIFFDTRLLPKLDISENECSDLADRINQMLGDKPWKK